MKSLLILMLVGLIHTASFSQTLLPGQDENGDPCSLRIILIDEELPKTTVETVGSWRFSRYMLVTNYFSNKKIWLGPKLTPSQTLNAASYWDANFDDLKGEYQEDRLIGGTLISGIIDYYKVWYRVDQQVFRYTHLEYDEVAKQEVILEQHTCSLDSGDET